MLSNSPCPSPVKRPARTGSSLGKILVAIALVAAAGIGQAEVKTAFPAERGLKLSEFPRVIKLAENVYGYEDIRAPGFTTNSFIVVGRDGVLLTDGQWTPAQTRTLVENIAKITDKPIKWYVVGSDHADHTGGNAMLPKDISFIVHPTSKAALEADARLAATKPNADPVVVPPTAMTGDKASVDIGGRTVDVLFLGRAHTGGDLLVHLKEEKILFMSEVYFNRVFPAMRSAYTSDWLSTLDKALAMDINHYIPGHGFIESGDVSRVQLAEFRGAVQYVTEESRRLINKGLTPDEAMKQADWGHYANWMLADSQRMVALQRVAAEKNTASAKK